MPRRAGVVGVVAVLGPLLGHGSTWGAEWALEAAIGGTCISHPASSQKKTPWTEGIPSLCLKAPSSLSHTNPQLLRPALRFQTPGLYICCFLCLECSFPRGPTYFSRPSWSVTSSWKASSTHFQVPLCVSTAICLHLTMIQLQACFCH